MGLQWKEAFHLPSTASVGDGPHKVPRPGANIRINRERKGPQPGVRGDTGERQLAGLYTGSQCLGEVKAPVSACWQGAAAIDLAMPVLEKGPAAKRGQVGEGR